MQRLAAGDYTARADLLAGGELSQLSRAVNRLAERNERQMRLRKRERDRLETVLHSTSDGVIMLDRRGYVAQINPAAERLLRLSAAKAIHQSFVQIVRDYRVADVWQQCVQQGQEQIATVEVSSGFFLRIHVTPLRKGAAGGFLVLLQDLSHLYRLEAVRRDFISNISHELRTPLASIKALVDTLRDGALTDPPAAEHFLGRMEIEVDSMTQMVQELLDLSRIESGQAPLRLFPAAVATLIEPAVERLRAQATRAGLTLTVVLPADLPADLPQVMVDADRIRQVVINLVHNAIKFTPAGGFITVTARAGREGGRESVVVSVADTGMGIPAEDVARIFERFYKADRARSGGGTGLGLAIAKHTIQAHNGRLWVESTEGKGSTFSFTLPLVNLPITQL
jgi:two-component system phosphate regulon sensor histidine kinase PhoR